MMNRKKKGNKNKPRTKINNSFGKKTRFILVAFEVIGKGFQFANVGASELLNRLESAVKRNYNINKKEYCNFKKNFRTTLDGN